MDSVLVMPSHNARLLTSGGNLWQSKRPTKNIYYASYRTSKASHHKRETQVEHNNMRFQHPSSNNHYKYLERGYTYQECHEKYVVKAIPRPSFDFESRIDCVNNFLDIFRKFCYPYAMIGIMLSAFSPSFLAIEKLSDVSLSFFIGALQAVVTSLLTGIYVVAVNQVFDFQIDKINKPYLPLASGQLSFTTFVIIAASSLTLSLGLSWTLGSWPLIWNNALTASIWSIYSFNVPLLRWKRHPLLATICHICPAFILPITCFLHMQTFVFKRPIMFPRSLVVMVLFVSLHQMSVAFAKDIPDVEGDKAYGVDTFAIRLGQKRVFWICIFLLEMAFGVAFLAGITSPYIGIKIVTGLGNVLLASILWHQTKTTNLRNKTSIRSFYMFIWKLLYAAYFFLALIR